MPAVEVIDDVEARWAAWLARNRAHDQRLRGKLVAGAAVMLVGAVILAVVYVL